MTACGGSALTNDASIATDTQNDRCADNPLADGCQADAGFLSVNFGEDNTNQEAEPSVAPPAPPAPKPVVNIPVVASAPTPVVTKTPPVLKKLAKKKTPPAPAPAPITSVDTSDFVPKTSPSTQSAPAPQRSSSSASGEGGASGQQSADVTAAATTAFTDLPTAATMVTPGFYGTLSDSQASSLANQFLQVGTWTHAINLNQFGYKSHLGGETFVTIPEEERNRVRTESTITRNDLDRTGAVSQDPLRMNLAQATYDGVAIGGNAADGIDFFTTNIEYFTGGNQGLGGGEYRTTRRFHETRQHYAGILSGTDLGAPFVESAPTATWNGSFRTHNTNAVDFQLTVTFGTTNDTRTISAFVKDGAKRTTSTAETISFNGRSGARDVTINRYTSVDNYYHLAGTYTEAGLITGTVNWGTFSTLASNGVAPVATDGETPGTARATNGTLMGLIGAEGAVGVFISNTVDTRSTFQPFTDLQKSVTSETTYTTGYVGGFVAAPSDRATGNPDATFKDWTRAIPTVTGGNNGFEAGGATGLTQTAIPNVINVADCEAYNARFAGETITTDTAETYTVTNNNHPTDDTSVINTPKTTTTLPAFPTRDCTTDSGSLKLAGAGFEEVTDSGVAFVTDGISLTTLTSGKSFAGLLSGTDLGAPISDANQVGEWKGQFKSVGGYYFGGASRADQYINTAVDTDFTLTVTFGDVSGKAGSIEAFVATHGINRRFLLAGTYDDKGVITGTVLAGLFDNDDKSNPSASINGVLTGLIGEQGAVGAFVSNKDNYNYAGGFVASPLTPDAEHDVTFGDWTRSFATEPALAPTTGTPQSEFLQTTGSTLATGDLTARAGGAITVTTLDLNTATLRNNPLGDDARDGVAFYQGYINSDGAGYAGIFSTTDLGRPITAKDARAEWRGQFQVIESRKINTDFTLEVTFGAVAGVDGSVGKVEAFVEQVAGGLAHHYISGTFNNAGVIKGTATAGFFPNGRHSLSSSGGVHDGILTGLIGQEGAVGAFYSHTGVYAGGFVALPFVRVPTGTTAFWARNALTTTAGVYPDILPYGTATLTKTGSEADDDPQANFMLAGTSRLALGADTRDGVTIPTAYNVNLGELADSDDAASGFALAHAQTTDNPTGNPERFNLYVGILSGTDVGAPFTDTNQPIAEWTGRLRLESPQAEISFNEFVKFTVAFSGTDGTITTGTIDLGTGRQTTNNLTIAGQFGANGVIYGTTTANLGSASENVTGTLSGLIGVDGAVAVFAGNDTSTNGSYAGGFVARPTVFANYDSWLDSLDTFPQAAGTHTGKPPSQFLQGGETEIDSGGVKLRGNLPVTVHTLKMEGDAEKMKNGVSFFQGHTGDKGNTSFSPRMFAGMLSGTNVGRTLVPYTSGDTVKATWAGKIRWTGFLGGVNFPGSDATARDIDLVVNYQDSTLEAFVKMDVRNHHLLLKAGYNELGQFTDGTVKYGIFAGADRDATRTADGLQSGRQFDKPFDGTLTGIIGSGGAVGVFINDTVTGDYGFAGGFWAAPDTANLADWTASFAAGGFNAAQDDLFAAGTAVTTIPSGTGRFIQWSDTRDFTPGGGLGKFSADTDILLLNGEANNGIGFRYNVSDTSGRGFAGLLSATDMGAPLTNTSKNTIWTGKIVGVVSASALAETELRLKVTYDAPFTNGVGTIQSIANQTNYTYATRAETVGAVNVRSNFPNTFNFNGGFDANGVITGTIAHTLTANGSTLNRTGVFSGLIGVRGAVGVFKNDDTNTDLPFVGGFVVKPPNS